MALISVTTKSGASVESFHWVDRELLIGKSKECGVILHGWRVDKVHAKIVVDHQLLNIFPIDGSKVFVNSIKVLNSLALKSGDVIEIGDYCIVISEFETQSTSPSIDGASLPLSLVTPDSLAKTTAKQLQHESLVQAQVVTNEEELLKKLSEECRSKVHRLLLSLMDLRRVNVGAMSDQELRMFTADSISEILEDYADFPVVLEKSVIAKQVLAEAVGLGPLEDLLEDDEISEIMVNAKDEIFYEKNGKLKKSKVTFTDDKAVLSAIERIVAPLGRRIDESSPMVDARLKDGSRVNAVIAPLALKGPSITIRKFMKSRLNTDDLIRFDSISAPMVEFLTTSIVRKQNLVISGGTGSGKTTLLNVLSNFIPADERIVTVEDAAELRLYQPNLVSLEARPLNQEGKGEVTIRDLVKNCLRMRPDRIVVGECRGGEALDMLQAMNTGHDGSLTTIHANSPRDCISRIEVLVLMSGMDLPVRAIREQISSAVNVIVQQTRFSCGTRKVTSIAEVTGVEGDVVQIAEIFKYKQAGYDQNGKVTGKFIATGVVPEFYERLRSRGIEVDMGIFDMGDHQ